MAYAGLKLITSLRLALNLQAFCLSLLNVGITSVYHHAQLVFLLSLSQEELGAALTVSSPSNSAGIFEWSCEPGWVGSSQ